MAYRAFVEDNLAAGFPAQGAKPAVHAVKLGPTEAMAVAVGMRDPASTLRTDGGLARWSRRLFGLGPARSLADPRLESLRRLTVRLHHQPASAAAEIEAARAVGITDGQIAAITACIGELSPT